MEKATSGREKGWESGGFWGSGITGKGIKDIGRGPGFSKD